MIRFKRMWRQYRAGDTATLDGGIEGTLVERQVAEAVEAPRPRRIPLVIAQVINGVAQAVAAAVSPQSVPAAPPPAAIPKVQTPAKKNARR